MERCITVIAVADVPGYGLKSIVINGDKNGKLKFVG